MPTGRIPCGAGRLRPGKTAVERHAGIDIERNALVAGVAERHDRLVGALNGHLWGSPHGLAVLVNKT